MQSKINVNTLEQTNIIHIKNVIGKETCELLSEKILKYKNNSIASEGTNPGCWRGDPHLASEEKGGFKKEETELLRNVIGESQQVFIEANQRPSIFNNVPHLVDRFDTENVILHAWFNVNDRGGSNVTHTHTGFFMSGVLYFQGSGTGNIEFYTQNYLYNSLHACSPYYGTARYSPEDGDLLLFPSNLAHHVEPNPNVRQRINMAFNIEYALRN